jgi:cobaltochelatase CobS
MATTRVFINKFPNRTCRTCGELIPIGVRFTWTRTANQPSTFFHIDCTPDGLATETEETAGETTRLQTIQQTATQQTANGWIDGLAAAIAPYLEQRLAAKLDRDGVEDIVQSMLDGAIFTSVTTVTIDNKVTGTTKHVGIQHKLFPTLLQVCQARTPNGKRLNLWLTGPAGGGKTKACENAAEALGLPFFHCGAMDNEYKLMGFTDAQGHVVNTEFKRWYMTGGVLCLDEVDSWLPAATLALNGALANGHCTFPDGMIKRHPDAIAIACANTWGLGGTNDYVGRMKQDAAFLDRFVKLDWKYDEALELVIAGNAQWVKRVQALRAKAKAKGLKVMISPRASEYGAGLLAQGLDQSLVEELTVKQGMTAEQWESIQ